MNSNEMNAVIDNLCDKLGITVQNITQLVPSLVKLKVISDLGWLIGCMALAILFFLLAHKAKRKEELETICDIYGSERFLYLTDLRQLPVRLVQIIARYL